MCKAPDATGGATGASAPGGSGCAGAPARPPFREAEKRYKLRMDQVMEPSAGKRARGWRLVERPTDFTGVLDLDRCLGGGGEGEVVLEATGSPSIQAFSFPLVPGLTVVRGAVTESELVRLASHAFHCFPEPPFCTNLSLLEERKGEARSTGLWRDWWSRHREEGERVGGAEKGEPATGHDGGGETEREVGSRGASREGAGSEGGGAGEAGTGTRSNEDRVPPDASPPLPPRRGRGRKPSEKVALDLLRWACVGGLYNWTLRSYEFGRGCGRVEAWLSDLGARLERVACSRDPGAPPFVPDAAICNYYRRGDSLCGHRDDAEEDATWPVVALSIGPPAVFLASVDPTKAPLAIWICHGDAVVMGGPARHAVHGVPRALVGGSEPGGDAGRGAGEVPRLAQGSPRPPPQPDLSAFGELAGYLARCRVSLSLRRADVPSGPRPCAG